MNVDTLRNTDAIDSVITNLQNNNIDIACIQETHNNRNDSMQKEDYAIFSIGGGKKKKKQKYNKINP